MEHRSAPWPPIRKKCRLLSVGVLWPAILWFGQAILKLEESYLERALALCDRDSVSSRVVPFLTLQTMADSDFPHGRRYYTKSGYFSRLDDARSTR